MRTRAEFTGSPRSSRWALLALLAASASWAAPARAAEFQRKVHVDVVAMDQPFLWNRLGAAEPGGMIYALKGDVVPVAPATGLQPGKVTLRPGKRPRPIVLRANVGDHLVIHFTNLLAPTPVNGSAVTRYAGVHVAGLELVPSAEGAPGIASDASWVGKNPSSLAAPGETKVYEYFAKDEGTFLLYNAADNVDDQGGGPAPIGAGQGLFGAVNIQPEWAEWYRSQVTRDDLLAATLKDPVGQGDAPKPVASPRQMTAAPQMDAPQKPRTLLVEGKERAVRKLVVADPEKHNVEETDAVVIDGRLYSRLLQPLINYHATYEGGPLRGQPVLKMLKAVVPDGAAPVVATRAGEFTEEQIAEAVKSFNAQTGLATEVLRKRFDEKGIFITNRARITGEAENAWLLTDPRRGMYLIRLVGDPAAGRRFEAHVPELHLVHSDLTAMVTGPNADRFPYDINSPSFFTNPVLPDRRQPYREFTIIYHLAMGVVQPFPQFAGTNKNTSGTFGTVSDNFAINYGMAGIGSEILANRLGVGPMGNPDAVDLKYEEFFLSSWAVGDPAMVVDRPANAPNQSVTNPDDGLRLAQQLLFTVDVTDDDRTMTELNQGKITKTLSDAFAKNGVTLGPQTGPRPPVASTVSSDSQWIILDAYNANEPPPPDSGRYPIVATGSRTENQKTITTLSVYKGFPINPGVLAYNSLSREKATKAFYPDDPSNVYHSNIRDHVKFRILHAGPGPSHVHHLHAHQWLHSPASAQSQYLDSQLIVPGSTYTLDMVHNGSGNRNLTVGDAIFHCHFYPHFAQGMWSLWRVHDVFEEGTWLDANGRPVTQVADVKGKDRPVYRSTKDGQAKLYAFDDDGKTQIPVDAGALKPAWNRALPDGEIDAGTPIPAIVPLPSLAMPLRPAKVRLTNLAPFLNEGDKGQGRRVEVEVKNAQARKDAEAKGDKDIPPPEYDNPGYPFFIPGIAGHRPPHPPMDFAHQKDVNGVDKPLNGGLPRHVVLGGKIVKQYFTRWDFTRDFIEYDKNKNPVAGKLTALELAEDGTPVEQAAMRHHSQRTHRSYLPNNKQGNITRNGLKARPGAPYAPPEVDDFGNADFTPRRYQAAVIQTDVVQNKQGWHYPQQRFLTLWEDVAGTLGGKRAPQPLFFRGNSNDTIEFWHTNLVPAYYELDDFQVRTPTDVIGQHIHNVKFDVTSSDGGANGFNYEDGTFSPQEVRDRINAINRPGDGAAPILKDKGLLQFNAETEFIAADKPPKELTVVPVREAYPARPGAGDPAHGLFGQPPAGQDWDGAQTTIQRWDADPLLDNLGEERTLRTIFTHDHLGPSTHQQAGLYAGLVVEPENSKWYLPNGDRMNVRADGGPTSWEGFIEAQDIAKSYREFLIEFQDTQLAYLKTSRSTPSNALFDPAASGAGASSAFDVGQYGDLARQQIGAFVATLNRGTVPPAFTQVIFPAMGIPLSSKAKVTAPAANVWRLQEPDDAAVNAGAVYEVRLEGTVANNAKNVKLRVYTPGIHPGWADPTNPLNAPTDGNNQGNGPPFAQLVSAGSSIGTYSMNYRNEPLLSRLEAAAKGAAPKPNATDPGFAFNSIPRNLDLLNTQPVPGTPINPGGPAPPRTLEIDGTLVNNQPTWTLGCQPATQVTVHPGDTIIWKATAGTHGVVFDTEAAAKAVLTFDAAAGAGVALGPQTVDGQAVWGTAPQKAGTVLATATVNSGAAAGTTLGFFCSQHGRAMSGSLAVAAAPAPAPAGAGFTYPAYLVPPSTPADPGGVEPTDPFTPLMRAYAHDTVQVRVLVGAHTQPHVLQIHGLKWLFEPDYPESGYKNAQAMGISEHFEMLFRLPPTAAKHDGGLKSFADYLVSPSSSVEGLANGNWGILRAFGEPVGTRTDTTGVVSPTHLQRLPNNPPRGPELPEKQKVLTDRLDEVKKQFADTKPLPANFRRFKVHATTIRKLLADRPAAEQVLSFNPRFSKSGAANAATYDLKNAMLFVRDEDLVGGKTLKPGAPLEPLILRVAAGDWVEITLMNDLDDAANDPALTMTNCLGTATPFAPGGGAAPLPAVPLSTTQQAGIHPALVGFDVTQANGVNVGFNPKATADPGQERKFYWYAGDVTVVPIFDVNHKVIGRRVAETPIEYGATNLVPADLMVQPQFGMVGALIVEPERSAWTEDAGTRASATVRSADEKNPAFRPFRDFVLVAQNLVANNSARWAAFNYRTEPFASRLVDPTAASPPGLGYAMAFSNSQLAPPPGADPVTPVFRAAAGSPARFRLVMPSTSSNNALVPPVTFDLHGHGWQEEPFVQTQAPPQLNGGAQAGPYYPSARQEDVDRPVGSYAESFNPFGLKIGHNVRSQFLGTQMVGPYESFNFVIDRAGGEAQVPGDYLYEALQRTRVQGLWGIFRVEKDLVVVTEQSLSGGTLTVKGLHQPALADLDKPATVSVKSSQGVQGDARVNGADRSWTFSAPYTGKLPLTLTIGSSQGGAATVEFPDPSAVPPKSPSNRPVAEEHR